MLQQVGRAYKAKVKVQEEIIKAEERAKEKGGNKEIGGGTNKINPIQLQIQILSTKQQLQPPGMW